MTIPSLNFEVEREISSDFPSIYVNCIDGRIPGPSQKNNLMIYACTIDGRIKPIEMERYLLKYSTVNLHLRV